MHLDFTRFELRIALAIVPQRNFTANRDNVFPSHLLRFRVSFGRIVGVADYLSDAVTIPQVDERKLTKVAPAGDPSHQGHGFSHVLRAQCAAGMSAL